MRVLLLALALSPAILSVQAAPPERQVAETKAQHQPGQQPTNFPRAAVAPAPPARTADDRVADYTFWLTLLTTALVLASIFQGVFIYRADRTARISAQAANDSAKAALIGQRAFIYLSTTPTRHENFALPLAHGTLRPLIFVNFGTTPARVERLVVSCRRWERGELEARQSPYMSGTVIELYAVWLAGNGAALGTQSVPVTASDEEIGRACNDADGVIALVGVLTYTDVFDQSHDVGFAYYMHGTEFQPDGGGGGPGGHVTMQEVPNRHLNYST